MTSLSFSFLGVIESVKRVTGIIFFFSVGMSRYVSVLTLEKT